MERRRFIALLSSSIPLSVAGCMGGDGSDGAGTTDAPTTTPAPTTEPTATTTPEDDGPLAIGDVFDLPDDKTISVDGIDSSVFVFTQDEDGADVDAESGAYYVRITFGGHGITDYEAFVTEHVTPVIEGETYGDPLFTYTSGFNTFTAAYRVPDDIVPYRGRVKLEIDGVSAAWEFDAGVIEAITRTVDYSVSSVSVPDAVAPGDSFEIEATVENGGDPMTFLAQVFGTMEAPIRVRQDVPTDGVETFAIDAEAPAAGDEDEFDVTLDWGADSIGKTVAFE